MSNGYAKLFSRILDSTIWREDDTTRILWITMLALADRDGIVHCTIPGLADRARITLPECELALDRFQQPDKYSWSKEEEGRRIRVVEGGWFLINHAKYRALMSADEQREKTRLRVQRHREANKAAKSSHAVALHTVTPVTDNESNDIAEAEAEAEADTEAKAIKPSVTEESFTLDSAVSFVLIETGLAGRSIREVIHQIIARDIEKLSVNPKACAEAMIEAWRQYDLLTLSFKLGPEKFYGTGMWRKSEQWKEGGSGNEQQPPRISASRERSERSKRNILDGFAANASRTNPSV